MTGWLLDTNVLAQLTARRPEERVVAWIDAQDLQALFVSVLTLGELDQGIANLPSEHPAVQRYQAGLRVVELRFAGRILTVSDPIVRRWGHLSGQALARTGELPPVIDTLLAATAIEYDLTLVTRNTKDMSLTGARLFNPWTDQR